jgi:YD repeat-containing protein
LTSAKIRFGYQSGILNSLIDPEERTLERVIDNAGRVVSVTDARGNTKRFEYDAVNRVKQITDAQNNTASFEYDANGNLLKVTDPRVALSLLNEYEEERDLEMRAKKHGRTPEEQFFRESEMKGHPQFMWTPFGLMPNPHYGGRNNPGLKAQNLRDGWQNDSKSKYAAGFG